MGTLPPELRASLVGQNLLQLLGGEGGERVGPRAQLCGLAQLTLVAGDKLRTNPWTPRPLLFACDWSAHLHLEYVFNFILSLLAFSLQVNFLQHFGMANWRI